MATYVAVSIRDRARRCDGRRVPALAWWRFDLNPIGAFWFAYVLTRPLGASFADYVSKPHSLSGANFGDGPTSAVSAIVLLVLVAYVSVTRMDVQRPDADRSDGRRSLQTEPEDQLA